MAKKKSNRKQIIGIKRESILWLIITVLVALLILTAWHAVNSSNAIKSLSSTFSEHLAQEKEERMQGFVNDVEERRYRYPVIDVKEERVYIPEFHLYVPLSENSREIRYQPISDNTIWLSYSIAVGRQTGNEDAPCDRVVILTSAKERAQGYIEAGAIRTKDGTPFYIFKQPTKCKLYGDEFRDRLADVVKQAQYY